jgi:NAD-dependent SIR2 family protein deacetylase
MTSEEFEIMYRLKAQQPHLVILGAGATMAAIPDGDNNGKKSAVMKGFLKEINKEEIIKDIPLECNSNNVENIYSELHEKPEYNHVVKGIEEAIQEYFKDMVLPESKLTIYDYLIVSLTNRDCIATFNWDPLLMQAYNRMRRITEDLPKMLFLHGNVAAELCEECKRYAPLQNKKCSSCGKPLKMPPLLYPVRHKDYNSNIFIKNQWDAFDNYCERAGLLTIFGYSSPKSDLEARNRIIKAYTSNNKRLDSIEIIDLQYNNTEFQQSWNELAKSTNYHINFYKEFWNSILAEYPRRSAEGYVDRFLRGNWNSSNIQLKNDINLETLADILDPLLN